MYLNWHFTQAKSHAREATQSQIIGMRAVSVLLISFLYVSYGLIVRPSVVHKSSKHCQESSLSPIVKENCLPGNPATEWFVTQQLSSIWHPSRDINADGDPHIQGFAHDFSVNLGETVHFKARRGVDVSYIAR